MALVFDNKIFFHIPKTGGQYTRAAIKNAAIYEYREIGFHHSGPLEVYHAKHLESFCVVRHPLIWYKSNYKYYIEQKWQIRKKNSTDMNMATYFIEPKDTFEQYIKRVLEMYEYGVATAVFSRYVPFVDHVLHTEQLANELKGLFNSWGYYQKINKQRVNATSNFISTRLSPETQKLLLQRESGSINYLGY